MRFYSLDLLSLDASDGPVIEEIKFASWKFNEAFNLPGGWTCTLATSDEKASPEYLAKERHCVFACLGDRILFPGMLWEVEVSADLKELKVGGQGIWSYWRDGKRNISKGDGNADDGFDWTNSPDQFQIVTQLMAVAQADDGENVGLSVVGHPPLSGVTRSLKIDRTELKGYAEVVEDFAKTDDGFDFAVNGAWVHGVPKLTLDLYYPQRGSVLENPWHLGSHVTLSKPWAESPGANRVDAMGATGPDGKPLIQRASAPAVDTIRIDRVVRFTDITDETTLLAQAKGERRRALRPQVSTTVQVQNHEVAGLGTFSVGDTVDLVGDIGYKQVDMPFRIVGYEASGTGATADQDASLNVLVDLESA